MKNSILVLLSMGLWAGVAPAIEGQPVSSQVTTAAPAPLEPKPVQESPDAPIGVVTDPNFTGSYSVYPRMQSVFGWAGGAREGEEPVSVVTFKTPDQATVDQTAEDLNILSLIFSKNLERALGGESGETDDFKLGIPMLLQTGGHWVDASYIEGFGAVFHLKVRFPLVPATAPDKDAQSASQNSEWEQARQALAGAPAAPLRRAKPFEMTRRFSPKLVETLKKRVLELLKNASNLRHVQPDESVVVTFTGPPSVFSSHSDAMGGAGQPGVLPQSPDAWDGTSSTAPAGASVPAGVPSSSGAGVQQLGDVRVIHSADRVTVMSIRIKKKDADALASNKMSEEQFFNAAEVSSYLGPAIVNDPGRDYLMLQSR